MSDRTIKWGIAGPGGISGAFAKDLAFASGAELVAVGGRNPDKARKFAAEHGVPRAYGSMEELAADPEVEIVYVGTVHPVHKENTLLFLRSGKSVLCEKPFAMNAAETEAMIAAAAENGVFLMEAMWTRYLPAIVRTRQWLAEGKIGEVKLLQAELGFVYDGGPEHRLINPELGGGALLDVGVYPVSFASMVFGCQPDRVESTVRFGETGVDEQFALLCDYGGGVSAMLNGSFRLGLINDAMIYGTKGRIHIPGFPWAHGATLHVPGEEPVAFADDRRCGGYAFEAEEAMACLRGGRRESANLPLNETLAIMRTLDTVRGQWGLRYPSERA